MIKIDDNTKIYIMPGYTDLRLGIDGYAHIVQLDFNNDPLDGSLYIFCNKNRDKIKILQFEYDGFWLYYKRLETGHIRWPKTSKLTLIEKRELRWLLDGLKLNQKALKKCNSKYVIL